MFELYKNKRLVYVKIKNFYNIKKIIEYIYIHNIYKYIII